MNRAIIFIFFTLLINITGIGLILPVLPELIIDLTSLTTGNASVIGGALLFAYAAPQFMFAPLMGNLSDRYGRRPILLMALFGYGIDNLLMAFAPSLIWLFAGRIIAGIFGASISIATAYIADISTPEKRAANFGMVGAAFGLGFILGPLIGGFIGEYGTRLPFFVAATLAFINLVFGAFVLPESLPEEKRRPLDIKRANPFGALRQIKLNKTIFALAFAYLLSEIAEHAYQSTWTFFTIERFSFTSSQIGLSLGVFGLLYALVNGWLIRVMIPRIGDVRAIWFGQACSIVGFLGFATLTEEIVFWAFLLPAALGGFLDPAMQGVMANETEDSAQGELQGALSSLTSLASIIGPLVMTFLFSLFTAFEKDSTFYSPGAPFLAAAFLLVIATVPIRSALAHRGQKLRG